MQLQPCQIEIGAPSLRGRRRPGERRPADAGTQWGPATRAGRKRPAFFRGGRLLLGIGGGDVERRQVKLLLCEIEIEAHHTVDDFHELGEQYEEGGLNGEG